MNEKTFSKAERQQLKDDFVHYAKTCLKIRTKQGRIAPFALNTAQAHIHAALEKQLAETGRVRAVILKGRQQGCSTYVEARFYWKVTHHKGRSAFILTHLDEASRGIYQIARRFHDHCPEAVKAKTRVSNSKEFFSARSIPATASARRNRRAWGAAQPCSFFTAPKSRSGRMRRNICRAHCRLCPMPMARK